MTIHGSNADHVWHALLTDLKEMGAIQSPRGKKTMELIGHQTIIDMEHPIVTNPNRKMGYRFMAAEAAWILSGDNRVETISPFSRNISSFSDDGITFFGAYGPKIMDQLYYIIESLASDMSTRQAVINIWRENPQPTKDMPCSLSVQFLVRDGFLHCVYTMRSSDAWLGWVYDVFNFSMLAACVAIAIRNKTGETLALGNLHLTAGSQHIYEVNDEGVQDVLDDWGATNLTVLPSFDPHMYQTPNHLVAALWTAARGEGALSWAIGGYSAAVV